MSIVSDILARWGYIKAKPPAPEMLLASADYARWQTLDLGITEAQSELYQRLSWVAIAVNFLSNAVSSQPFNVKRMEGEQTVDVPNHPFETLLRRPNPMQSRFEFIEATAAYRTLTGNAYWYLNTPRGDNQPPIELWVIPSHRIKPIPDGRQYIRCYEYDTGANRIEVPVSQIVHFKRFHPLNPYIGLSPIESIAITAEADLAMQRWNANFFSRDNAKIPGALAYSDMIDESTWQRMRDDIRRNWGGTARSGPLMLRGVGTSVNWISMALSQKDMEFLDGRQASKEEIFQMFGVPPGLIDKNATEANAMAAKASFAEYTLWPLLCALSETITNTVLTRYGDDLVGEFGDPRKSDRLVDLQEQQEYAKTHTLNEIRAEYYGDDPLRDARGDMLPAEIAPGVVSQSSNPMTEPTQPTPATETTAEREPVFDTAMMADLQRWRQKSRRRAMLAAPFSSENIPQAVSEAVKLAGFDWITRYVAKNKQPVQPDRAAEQALQKQIERILSENGENWATWIENGENVDITPMLDQMRSEMTTSLTKLAADQAIADAVGVGVDFDTVAINDAAFEWASRYSYELVKGIEDTTRQLLQKATSQFVATPGMTNAQLTALLEPAYDSTRAQMIAVTEITRAYAQGTAIYQNMLIGAGLLMRRVWHASADEVMCPICGELNGEPEERWNDIGGYGDGPPAHPNCRCWTTLERVPR
jgi:HK97 family phage portal protein